MEESIQFTYQRNLNYTYLVYGQVLNEDHYELQMLVNNRIPGMLACHMQKVDGMVYLYYDISSKQSIEQIFEKTKMNYSLLKALFFQIKNVLVQLDEYLLPSGCLMTLPKMIYMNPEQQEFYFCLVLQEQSMEMPFQKLLEFILEYVDYNDEKAVAAAYACYKRLNQENASFGKIYEEVFEERNVKEKSSAIEKEVYKEVAGEMKKNDSYDSQKKEQKAVLEDEEIFLDEEEKNPAAEMIGAVIEILENKPVKSILLIMLFGMVFIVFAGIFYQMGKEKICAAVLVDFIIGGFLIYRRQKQPQNAVQEEGEFFVMNEPESIPQSDTGEDAVQMTIQEVREDKPVYGQTVFMENPDRKIVHRLEPSDRQFETFSIQTYPFVIGKLEGAVDGIVQHETVSRIHCKIDYEEERYYVVDLNSTNGTLVNGELLEGNERRELRPGDVLGLGEAGYTFL